MGRPSSRLILTLWIISLAASYALVIQHSVVQIEHFLLFLLAAWIFFLGGLLFLFFASTVASFSLTPRLTASGFAPTIQVRVLKQTELLPPLLIPKPAEPHGVSKEEPTPSREKMSAVEEKSPDFLAQVLRHTWLTPQ